jgi:hypothetical protein
MHACMQGTQGQPVGRRHQLRTSILRVVVVDHRVAALIATVAHAVLDAPERQERQPAAHRADGGADERGHTPHPQIPCALLPARPFPSSIFLVKNRRDIGKSQSIWTDSQMETARLLVGQRVDGQGEIHRHEASVAETPAPHVTTAWSHDTATGGGGIRCQRPARPLRQADHHERVECVPHEPEEHDHLEAGQERHDGVDQPHPQT